MNQLDKFTKPCLPACLILLTSMSQAYAGCSRSDIDYYLSKGFTTEQITAICSTPESPAETTNASDKVKKENAPERPDNNAEQFLREALKVRNIVITDVSLQFTRKVCIAYGEEDLYGFTPKACPKIRYAITLNGLEVIKSEKKYMFYGDEELHIKSNIKRDVIEGLDNLKPEERELILNKLESGDKTIIPVREDVDINRVKRVLENLAN